MKSAAMKSAAAVLAGALLFTACGGSDVAGPDGSADGPPSGDNALVDPNRSFAPGTPVQDYGSLVAYLRSTDALVLTPGPAAQAYLSVEGRVIDIDGEWVQVYEYATSEEAEREAKAAPPSGVPDGMMTLVAVTPPTLHLSGKILVLSTNPSGPLRSTLDTVLGKPLADPRDSTSKSEPARAFNFADLARGTVYAGGPERPVVLHVTTAAEATVLARLVDDPDLAQKLNSFDASAGALVAVFRGVVPTAGYDLRIDGIDADGASVRIRVALGEPDGPVAQVLSYPYDIIRITDEGTLPESAVWSVVTADGENARRGA